MPEIIDTTGAQAIAREAIREKITSRRPRVDIQRHEYRPLTKDEALGLAVMMWGTAAYVCEPGEVVEDEWFASHHYCVGTLRYTCTRRRRYAWCRGQSKTDFLAAFINAAAEMPRSAIKQHRRLIKLLDRISRLKELEQAAARQQPPTNAIGP